MLVLLPPSETKRDGGDEGSRLDLGRLAFPELTAERRTIVRAVADLARDPDAAARALKLGPRQAGEVERDRLVESSPTMPALRRYTGVLYDPIGADALDEGQLAFAGCHVAVHSALFGPVMATDPIPAYRLSHDSRVPGLRMKAHWMASVRRVLEGIPGLVLDLRSDGYAALGPRPDHADSTVVRVVARGEDGTVRALNHFNKKAKGELVRALVLAGRDLASVDELLDWAAEAGVELTRGGSGDLVLVTAPH
ncbi:peroxide stress protein YaaA [Clavibacter sp. km1a]|uniref:peroxide stress protein YaaA n=1 Tax=Clavibacter sp. km1a TaxID=3459136 RepID=UPI004042A0D8